MFSTLWKLLSVRPALDDRVLRVLGETRLFENLSLLDLEKLAGEVERRSFEDGDPVFRQDDPGDGLYIIDSGAAEIFIAHKGGTRQLALLRDREYFGEMALIDDAGVRTASARAKGRLECYYLSKRGFERLLSASHATAAKILLRLGRVLSRRLAATSRLAAGLSSEDTVANAVTIPAPNNSMPMPNNIPLPPPPPPETIS